MNLGRLSLSIALGALIVLGLFLGLSLTTHSAMASAVDRAEKAATLSSAADAIPTQETPSTVYVVVRFGDNDVIVRAVTFTHPITSYRALELAGLDPVGVNTAYGLMLCGINGVGKALPDGTGCDNDSYFWSTSYWSDGTWKGYLVGVGQAVISKTGHVDAFSWSSSWPAPNPPPVHPITSALHGLDWLRDQQQDDGGFGTPGSTADVLTAIGANRMDATKWRNGPSVLANLISRGKSLANTAAGAGKLAIALAANAGCWPIGTMQPMDYYSPTAGTISVNPGDHAQAMIGVAALNQTVPVSAIQHLRSVQLPDGGWEWGTGWGADTNSTALALQALVAAGEPVTSTAIISALNYLANAQNGDGGFPYDPNSPWGTDSDTNSTAYVVQALWAVGEDPLTGTWTVTSSNPISFLLSMQLPNGSFEWLKGLGANQLATQQAIPALLHRPFLVKIAEPNLCYGVSGRVTAARAAGGQQISANGGDPIPDVTVWAQGTSDLYFGTAISPTGYYTISVPTVGSYELAPAKVGYVFSPTVQVITVGGSPGEVTSVGVFQGGNTDISVIKDGEPDTVTPGEQLTYTLAVHNAGPFDAQNVIVTDTLPYEIMSPLTGTVILPDPPGSIVMPGKVLWDLGDLVPGATKLLTVVVKVQPWVTQTFTNTAMVATSTPDPNLANNEASASVEVQSGHFIYLPIIVKNI
jgi:uncharacterized repeat protein (TIGR01451 family)